MASKRLLLQTLDSWRDTLVHVKEKKARLAERKRRQNRKSMIQKPQKSF